VDDFSALMWTFFPPSSFSDGPLFRGRFFPVNHFSVDVFSVDVISVDLFSYIPATSFYHPILHSLNPTAYPTHPLTQNRYSFYHILILPTQSLTHPPPCPTQLLTQIWYSFYHNTYILTALILILPQYLHTYCTDTHFTTVLTYLLH